MSRCQSRRERFGHGLRVCGIAAGVAVEGGFLPAFSSASPSRRSRKSVSGLCVTGFGCIFPMLTCFLSRRCHGGFRLLDFLNRRVAGDALVRNLEGDEVDQSHAHRARASAPPPTLAFELQVPEAAV
jgi:hypothetical protein